MNLKRLFPVILAALTVAGIILLAIQIGKLLSTLY